MNRHNNINDELNGLNSNLPSSSDNNPFSVPEGYFDGLATSIMAKIKGQGELSACEEIASLSPLIAGIPRTMPYAIPEHYFQAVIDELPVFIRDEDSLVLSFIDKTMPYQVPLGYFSNLPEQVLSKLHDSKPKVVHLGARKWMRYAVAAMVTGIIAFSGYFYLNQKNNRLDADRPLAHQLKNVSTKELDEFIKTTDISSASMETARVTSSPEVEKLLTGVTDTELEAFLMQVPTDDEDLLVIN
ncbi:MAG TPA: hypothetical protein VFQ73_06615 [Flavisolibacter sp.]|nr:hypothetical protein [Flavisolibacter sp.]